MVPALNGGKPCDGGSHEIQGCNPESCYDGIDCVWGEWERWSGCSRTCGGGERMRSRSIKVEPRKGGMLCEPLDTTEI